jgi:hypothetical protein
MQNAFPIKETKMLGYVLRLTQGSEREFYCTKQLRGCYLTVFRRQEEITGAIAFLQEGHLIPMASPVTMEAVGVASWEDLLAMVKSSVHTIDGLAIALEFRSNGSVTRWGVCDWHAIRSG